MTHAVPNHAFKPLGSPQQLARNLVLIGALVFIGCCGLRAMQRSFPDDFSHGPAWAKVVAETEPEELMVGAAVLLVAYFIIVPGLPASRPQARSGCGGAGNMEPPKVPIR